MQINQIKRVHANTKRMTVARGGKRGKTSGRGGKGQTARAGNKRRPEWREMIKKIPKLRGRGKNSNISFYRKPAVVSLAALESVFEAGAAITPAVLIENGLVNTWSGNIPEVKILGAGPIAKAFKVSGCAISETAQAAIIKAGGTFTAITPKAKTKIVAARTGPKAGAPTEAAAKPEAAPKKAAKKPATAKPAEASKPAAKPKAEKKA